MHFVVGSRFRWARPVSSPKPAFVIESKNVIPVFYRMSVDKVEGMTWGFQAERRARVQQQPAWIEVVSSVPRLCGIEEDLSFYNNERNVEVVEEGNRLETPIDVRIE